MKYVMPQKPLDESIQRRVFRVVDELRDKVTLHDSHLFLLVLCATFRRASLPQFSRGSASSFEYARSIQDKVSANFENDFSAYQYLSEYHLGMALELAQELAMDVSSLRFLWDEARKTNRSDRFSRYLDPITSELCVRLGELKVGYSAGCMFTAAFDLVESLQDKRVSVTVEERDNAFLATLYSELFDMKVDVSTLHAEEILEQEQGKEYDVVFSAPPLGFKIRPESARRLSDKYPYRGRFFENVAILDARERAKRRAVLVLPAASLSRTTTEEREFKRQLLVDRAIEAIIKLPVGSLSQTRLPAAIVVLRGSALNPTEGVFMADAAEVFKKYGEREGLRRILAAYEKRQNGDLFKIVEPREIERNLFNMDPSRYVSTETNKEVQDFFSERNCAELDELIEIQRAPALSDSAEGGEDICEVSISDITEIGDIRTPQKRRKVGFDLIKKIGKLALMPGDVLLSVKGSVGHVAIVPEHEGIWFAGQVFVTLRPKVGSSQLSPQFVTQFLRSKVGQSLIKSKQIQGAMQTLSAQDLKSLPIPVPDVDETERVTQVHRDIFEIQERIERLRADIAERQQSLWS
jgi:type I restriction enzyme M protein